MRKSSLVLSAGLICLMGICFLGGWGVRDLQVKNQTNKEKARLLEQRIEVIQEKAEVAERIDREVVQQKRAARDRATDRAVIGDGLRVRLEDIERADAGECRVDGASPAELAQLLNEGRSLLEEGAAIVDEALPMIDGLQARERATDG